MQGQPLKWYPVQQVLLSMLLVSALTACSPGIDESDTTDQIEESTNTPEESSNTPEENSNTGGESVNTPEENLNTPPVVGNVAIEPAAPNVTSRITAKHGPVTDDDNDNLTVSYLWRINDNEPIVSSTPDLPDTPLKRGDQISVQLIATDGANKVSTTSPNEIVSNAPPQATLVTILPADAQSNDNLSVDVSGQFDADGDDITTTFTWFLNGVPMVGQSADVLGAGIAMATDLVAVEVTLSDGFDSTPVRSSTLQLQENTSSYLVVEPAMPVMDYGTPSNFTVKFVDDEGNEVQTTLAQGPDGFSYDAATATATWTPTPSMSLNSEIFYAQFNSSDGQTESVQITVVNDQKPLLLARSGIPIPDSDFELDIGDFDADGRAEVLSTDSRELIFTLEFDGNSITQDWLYPFSVAPGETILRVWAHGADLSQIVVVTTRGVSLIESRSELPTRLLDTTYDIAATAFGDLDNDGTKEVLLINPLGEMSTLSASDWTLSDFGETLTPAEWPNYTYTAALGNVDDDPALEIVTDSGQVIDGATGEIQWTHFARFGTNIAIGDVDGDGDTDIVASDRWQNITSYDPVAKTSLWTYTINDFCSLRLYNVDDDPQDELVAGPCQHGSVEIYDGVSNTMVLQDDIDDPDYNSALRSYSFGDLDSDGIDELIFSTGSGSTAEDNMAVVSLASLGDSTPGVVVNVNPSQIYGFKSIGWDTTTTAQERAVFVLPDTEGGADGQRIGLLSSNGEFTVSETTAANWENVDAGIVVDSNADGINEVLVGTGNVRDGEVHHIALDDFSQIHVHTALGGANTNSPPEIVSIALGIDSDGSAKAIIAHDELLFQVYDIASMQAEWTSGGLSGGQIKQVTTLNNASGFDIVAATATELTLWKKSGTAYVKNHTAAIECTELMQVTINNEEQIACLYSDDWAEESKITLFNSALIKQSELSFDHPITAISFNPDGNFIIGVTVEMASFYGSHENTLRTIDPANGTTLWTSAPLLGRINGITFLDAPASGNTKMAVSTSAAMYISD